MEHRPVVDREPQRSALDKRFYTWCTCGAPMCRTEEGDWAHCNALHANWHSSAPITDMPIMDIIGDDDEE